MNYAAGASCPALPEVMEEARPQARKFTVILTSGDEDGGRRATLAFLAACSARAMDVEAQVYMVGDGVCWGQEHHADHFHVAGYPPLHLLIDDFLRAGGQLYQCSAKTTMCNPFKFEEGRHKPREGVQIMGFASLVDQLSSSSAITF